MALLSAWPCRSGACRCSAEGSRMRHDLFTVLCCAMCFTYSNSWFLLSDDAENEAGALLMLSGSFFSSRRDTVGNVSCSSFPGRVSVD